MSRFRLKLALTIAAILSAALCFLAIGGIFCAFTMHVPRTRGATPPNAENVELIARDGVKLRGWWMRSSPPGGNCVVVLHGIADSRRSSVGFAPMFLAQGYSVLIPDSRAHGESGGELVTYGLLEKYDVIDWAHWMRANGCDKIYGLGESLGASILIQAAAVEPIFSAIVAECPYADLREVADYRMRRLLRLPALIAAPIAKLVVTSGLVYAKFADGLDLRQVSPVNSIVHAPTPILLIHGLADVNTPPSQSRKLALRIPGTHFGWSRTPLTQPHPPPLPTNFTAGFRPGFAPIEVISSPKSPKKLRLSSD